MVKSHGINGSKSHPSHFMGNPNKHHGHRNHYENGWMIIALGG